MAKLALVPTPIGNLEDITLRAIRYLKEADIIFAEDTRVTQKLLKHLGIQQKVISSNPRSTVGTTTEIYDYLKLFYARVGKTYF